MDDKSIIELYWQRDEEAIRQTQLKYGRYCYAIAHNILRSRDSLLVQQRAKTYSFTGNSLI